MFQKAHTIRRGFTLVELLIVLSIIGLLAGIVLTSLSGARVKAKEAAYLAYVRSAGTAVEVALTLGEFDDYSGWEDTLDGSSVTYSAATADCWLGQTQQVDFVNRISTAANITDCAKSPYSEDYGLLFAPLANASDTIDGVWLFLYTGGAEHADLCTKLPWSETIYTSPDDLVCGVYIYAN